MPSEVGQRARHLVRPDVHQPEAGSTCRVLLTNQRKVSRVPEGCEYERRERRLTCAFHSQRDAVGATYDEHEYEDAPGESRTAVCTAPVIRVSPGSFLTRPDRLGIRSDQCVRDNVRRICDDRTCCTAGQEVSTVVKALYIG